MKDESPCGGVRKERSGEEENELRRTSRTVCPGWPPPLFFGFFFFFGGVGRFNSQCQETMESGSRRQPAA